MARDSVGTVYVITSKCIGCLACLYACPFSIPELDYRSRAAVKCDLCKDLREKALEPACVAICPTGALVYGFEKEVFNLVKLRTAESIIKARYEAASWRT